MSEVILTPEFIKKCMIRGKMIEDELEKEKIYAERGEFYIPNVITDMWEEEYYESIVKEMSS